MRALNDILVPTDFSENARSALNYAVRLAEQSDGTVHALTVPQAPVTPFLDASFSIIPEDLEDIVRVRNDAIEAFTESHCGGRVKYRTEVREGVVHRVIMQYANEHDVDAIVIGTRGLRGVTKAIFGSVTGRIIRTADRPVVIVPLGGDVPPASILVAYDFSESSARAAQAARLLGGMFSAQLFLAHACVDPWDEDAADDAARRSRSERRREALELGFGQLLDEAAADLFPASSPPVQTRLAFGDPGRVLLGFGEDVGANLICAGSTGKGRVERALLGSVARTLVQESAVPVLLVPP